MDDVIQFPTARPSISLSPITMPSKPLSEEAMTRLGRLARQLGSALKGGYIRGGLKDAIEQDPDFRLSISMDPIHKEAFDHTDKRTLADFALADTLQQVKVFQVPLFAQSLEETKAHGASALSGHLLSLLPSFTAGINYLIIKFQIISKCVLPRHQARTS